MTTALTGNLVWFAFEHPETPPAKADNMPDPDRHIHFVIPNLTYDPGGASGRPSSSARSWTCGSISTAGSTCGLQAS